jgi:hypothetical protein
LIHCAAGPHFDRSLEATQALGKKASVALNASILADVLDHAP